MDLYTVFLNIYLHKNITTKYLLAVIFQSAVFAFEVFLQLCVFY